MINCGRMRGIIVSGSMQDFAGGGKCAELHLPVAGFPDTPSIMA